MKGRVVGTQGRLEKKKRVVASQGRLKKRTKKTGEGFAECKKAAAGVIGSTGFTVVPAHACPTARPRIPLPHIVKTGQQHSEAPSAEVPMKDDIKMMEDLSFVINVLIGVLERQLQQLPEAQ